LFAIRVNVAGFVPSPLRALRALRLLRDFGERSRPRSYFERTVKPTIIQDLAPKVSRFCPLKATTVFKTATLALSAPWATAVLVRQVLEKGDNLRRFLRRFPPSENSELNCWPYRHAFASRTAGRSR
jgi:hypothetical protein